MTNSDAAMDYELIQKLGRRFKADAVLSGTIYRWDERQGTGLAVNRPASVAFDLNLVRSTDGAIIWRGVFEKTQRSLSENILDARTFFHGGARWMTAEGLGKLGLQQLLDEMMRGKKAKED